MWRCVVEFRTCTATRTRSTSTRAGCWKSRSAAHSSATPSRASSRSSSCERGMGTGGWEGGELWAAYHCFVFLRFFYLNADQYTLFQVRYNDAPSSLTLTPLCVKINALKQISLSRVICETGEDFPT